MITHSLLNLKSLLKPAWSPILIRTIKGAPSGPNDVTRYPWSKYFRINKTRCNFPRASENKRIKTHGYDVRMSTVGGRKVLMNRVLKGRHVLSH